MPNSETTQIAVLKERQAQMTSDIVEIKQIQKEQGLKLDDIKTMLASNFVSYSEYNAHLLETNRAIDVARASTDKALEEARKATFIKQIVSVVITAVITGLVFSYFHLGAK